jgi:hypothetical protein
MSARLDARGEQPEDSDSVGDGRKLSAAVQQTLDRLPPSAELDRDDAEARTLIAVAAEDCAWAWRMLQAPAVSPAVAAAARVLADHAAGCCDEAGELLGLALLGEPGDGA